MMYKRNEMLTKTDPLAKCLYSIYDPDTSLSTVLGN